MNHTNEIMLWGRGGTLGTEGRSAGSYNELTFLFEMELNGESMV